MTGKKRSGLASDRRAYGCCSSTPNYTITYNGNTNTSGNAPIDGSSPYVSGSTVTVLGNSGSPILAKSGFIFAGWNTIANGSGTSYSQGNTFIINANTTLYAQWTPTYTITYNGNTNTSGNAPIDGSSPYVSGSTVTVLGNSGSPVLAKSGFIFAGWNTIENGSGTSYSQGNTFIINANTTLYAQWTPTYTFTYNGNTNTSGNAPIDGSSPYVSGSSVTVLGNSGSPVLAKSGYTFAGWNTAANGSGTPYSQGNTFTINANTILYAQWTPVTYTIAYNGNTNTSGNAPIDGSSPYASGSTVTVLGNSGSPVLAKSGYTFAGWNTAANGSGTPYSQGNTFTINTNTILYAQWTPVTYTIAYNGNTNTSGNAPIDGFSPYVSGSTVTVLGNSGSPVLAKSGYTFAGWNTAANGSGISYSQGNTFTINANRILYAQWAPFYTITYNGNTNTSGNVPTDGSSPYASGSMVTVLGNSGSPVLAKSGYTFAGWNTIANGSGISNSQGNRFIIYANITLYAQWRPVDSSPPSTPTSLSSVGGNQAAYILFTQSGSVTNYEYSTDNGTTFVSFNPPQTFSPVNITTLSADGVTRLNNGTTYTVKLKAVNSAGLSSESVSVNVTPTITNLATTGRLIHLDANNTSSYSGTGTTWTNLDSAGVYSATLQNSPNFDNINKWFTFNGINQIAQITQNTGETAINPTLNNSFTIQIWARVNTTSPQFASWDGLISKQAPANSYDGYALSLTSSGLVNLSMNSSVNGNYPSTTGVYSNDWALYTIVVSFGVSGNPSYTYVSTRRVVTVIHNDSVSPSPDARLQFPRGIQETNTNFCQANVGAFYLYNTALSQEDIIRNYDATKPRYNI